MRATRTGSLLLVGGTLLAGGCSSGDDSPESRVPISPLEYHLPEGNDPLLLADGKVTMSMDTLGIISESSSFQDKTTPAKALDIGRIGINEVEKLKSSIEDETSEDSPDYGPLLAGAINFANKLPISKCSVTALYENGIVTVGYAKPETCIEMAKLLFSNGKFSMPKPYEGVIESKPSPNGQFVPESIA